MGNFAKEGKVFDKSVLLIVSLHNEKLPYFFISRRARKSKEKKRRRSEGM